MNISSDSEDTIIVGGNEPSDTEIEEILKKYNTRPTTTPTFTISPSCSSKSKRDDCFNEEHVENTNKYNDDYVFMSLDVEDAKLNYDDLELDHLSYNKLSPEAPKQRKIQGTTYKQNEKILEKTRKRQEAEMRKVAKNVEKAQKKEAIEKQKMIKNALRSVAKSTKPDECMNYIIVELDTELSENEYGVVLKEAFQRKGILVRTKSQILTNLVSWVRKIQTIENTLLKESEVNENNFLAIMRSNEFMDHVNKDTLVVYIQNIFLLTKCKQLSVVVLGIEKSKPCQENAIIEVQMLTKAYFRFVKNIEDLGDLVLELTKAVAQIPYKLKKEEKYKHHNEYFNDSNKDTVKVDKNGNGLGRLWHQMLTMFPMARLETAEAITAVYPTPASLFQAYEICENKKEDLLQDLTIRRAHGPLISGRRIGPELSRKCYNFFCASENKFL